MQRNIIASLLTLTIINVPVCYAHGTMESPISRIYNCYKEGPENVQSAACKAVVAVGGKQPLYDWDMINQFNANDQHRQIIPDGTLCAGGRDKYAGMNLPRTDWVTTTIKPDSSGHFNFVFRASVPHASKYFELYLTKPGYDFNQPLKWADLEDKPFCRYTTLTLDNGRYNMNCSLANQSGRRIVFGIWQRSDSAEAFYSCSDVIINSDAPMSWHVLKNLSAYADVKANTQIVFWLMKDCQVVESHSFTATMGQNQADQWPYYLAQRVNANSNMVQIGQQNAQGDITPVMSANLNNVYVKDNDISHYYVMVDFVAPGQLAEELHPEGIANYCQSHWQLKAKSSS